MMPHLVICPHDCIVLVGDVFEEAWTAAGGHALAHPACDVVAGEDCIHYEIVPIAMRSFGDRDSFDRPVRHHPDLMDIDPADLRVVEASCGGSGRNLGHGIETDRLELPVHAADNAVVAA